MIFDVFFLATSYLRIPLANGSSVFEAIRTGLKFGSSALADWDKRREPLRQIQNKWIQMDELMLGNLIIKKNRYIFGKCLGMFFWQ